jgi:hypothetical protein
MGNSDAKQKPAQLSSCAGFGICATVIQNLLNGFSLQRQRLLRYRVELVLQCFPFLSGGLLSPRLLLLLGGGFSPFGVTTTVFGGLGGRSFRFCADAPAAIKQPIAAATSFRFKSNIEFPILLMHSKARMGGRVRDAPTLAEQERCQKC